MKILKMSSVFFLPFWVLLGCGEDPIVESKASLRDDSLTSEELFDGNSNKTISKSNADSNLCISASADELKLVNVTYENLCQSCHAKDGKGSNFAPTLIEIEFSAFENVVRKGKGSMPSFAENTLSEEELLSMYTKLQKDSEGFMDQQCEKETVEPPANREQTVSNEEGDGESEERTLFDTQSITCDLPTKPLGPKPNIDYKVLCAGCHGAETEGTNFAPGFAENYSPEAFNTIVRQGKGGMPAFTEKVLDSTSIEAIRLYISAVKNHNLLSQNHDEEVERLIQSPECQGEVAEGNSEPETTSEPFEFKNLALTCEEDAFHLSEKIRVITRREFLNILDQVFPRTLLSNESVQTKIQLIPDDYQKAGFASYKETLSYVDTDNQLEAVIEIGFKLMENKDQFNLFYAENSMSCDATNSDSDHVEQCKEQLLNNFLPWLWGGKELNEGEKQAISLQYENLASDENFTNAEALTAIIIAGFGSHKFWFRTYNQGNEDANDSNYRMLTSREFASRMALDLTGRLPDPELWASAKNNQLESSQQIELHFNRLFSTEYAKNQFSDFTKEWLNLNYIQLPNSPTLSQTQKYNLVAGATSELSEIVAEEVITGGKVADLFSTKKIIVKNQTMADIYGLPIGNHESIDESRNGITTRIGMLLTQVQEQPSAIIRGHHIRTELLCDEIGDPPPTAPTEIPPVDNKDFFSSREALENATSSPSCSFCHSQINPLGLAFGNYDGLGKLRTEEWVEHKKTGEKIALEIDTNVVPKLDLEDGYNSASGAISLNKMLANHDKPKACFGKKYFQFLTGKSDVEEHCSQKDFSTSLLEGKSVREAIWGLIISRKYRMVSNQ